MNRNFLREKYSLGIKCAPPFWHISHQRTFTTMAHKCGLGNFRPFENAKKPRVVGNLSLHNRI